MGLCKCRTVTTLFCFEHRRNVCERCVISEHPKCIVKTYLQWLQDSDYDSNCPLCHEPFFIESTTGESSTTTTKQGRLTTIRLSCFDLFHWECLEAELGKSGGGGQEQPLLLSRAKCPICRVPVLPTGNSPLLMQIRNILMGTKWANQVSHLSEKESSSTINNNERDQVKGPMNTFQSNEAEMISIEIGGGMDDRSNFSEQHYQPFKSGGGRRQPEDPKFHPPPMNRHKKGTITDDDGSPRINFKNQLFNITRVILNCLMLRNLRMFSLGISPRQTLIISIVIFVGFFLGFHFIIPLLQPVVTI